MRRSRTDSFKPAAMLGMAFSIMLLQSAPAWAAFDLPIVAAPAMTATTAKPNRSGRLVAVMPQAPVPFEYYNGYILFKVRVANRDVWAMLDSGAQRSVVDRGLARQAGLTAETTGFTAEMYSGKIALEIVKDVPLLIPGQFETRVPQLAVVDLAPVSAALHRKIEFVLGEDALRIVFVVINPENKTIQFGPSGRSTPPAGASLIPLKNGYPHLEATIDGQPVTLLVDLGSARPFTLSSEAWARLGPSAGVLDGKTGLDEQGRPMKLAHVPQLRIGPATVTDAKVVIRSSVLGRPGVDGTVGNPFFLNNLLVIDQTQGKLWMLPAKAEQTAP